MNQAPGTTARAARIAASVLLLWLIWRASPGAAPVPDDGVAVVASRAALAALPPGREFLLEGVLHPAAGITPTWRGHFAYRQVEHRKDDLGVRAPRVLRDQRPAVRLRGEWGELTLPAGSYSLRHAPEVGAEPWHAWSQENAGFRPGDAAVALGVVNAASVPVVGELAEGPLDAFRRRRAGAERSRSLLLGAGRVLASLLVLAYAAGALFPPRPAPEAPR